MIFIYCDEGTSADSVAALKAYFSTQFEIRCIAAKELQERSWIYSASLFVMPGGRSLPFYAALGEAGNQHIIDFVMQGGTYLGLCAGAYYAAEKTLFALNSPLELLLSGPLNFFKGNAIGPVFKLNQFAYRSESGAEIVSVRYQENTYPVYFNGGCYFELTAAQNHVNILATYTENDLPAVIDCSVGLGKVILSGVHPELSLKGTANAPETADEILRKKLWKVMVEKCGLSV